MNRHFLHQGNDLSLSLSLIKSFVIVAPLVTLVTIWKTRGRKYCKKMSFQANFKGHTTLKAFCVPLACNVAKFNLFTNDELFIPFTFIASRSNTFSKCEWTDFNVSLIRRAPLPTVESWGQCKKREHCICHAGIRARDPGCNSDTRSTVSRIFLIEDFYAGVAFIRVLPPRK